jgi:type II secretory pathway predicted ATPase ExeA
MLLEHFKLFEQPFGVTPDPRFLYLGAQHREALASLVYTTDSNRGFVAMIAQPGMGKTSLLYNYLEMLRTRARTAFVFRTDCNAREFIRHILLDLGIDSPMSDLPAMHDALNRVLLEEHRANRRFVLVIDEAQNLSDDVLESIRLLSNFETPWMKLMHIVLAGQPQLADQLAKPSMMQLRQRISQIIRIEPFTEREVNAYVDRRLQAAGCKDLSIFTEGARSSIAQHSEGIPRNINNICFNAMSLACAMKRKSVDREIVDEVMRDLAISLRSREELRVPERTRSYENTSVAPAEHRRSKGRGLVGWIPRFALSGLLTASLALGFGVDANGSQKGGKLGELTGETSKVWSSLHAVALETPGEISGPSVLSMATPETSRGAVVVSTGETLFGICNAKIGRYDPKTLTEIQKLNPWLTDPDLIPAGQEIILPQRNVTPKTQHRDGVQQDVSAVSKRIH